MKAPSEIADIPALQAWDREWKTGDRVHAKELAIAYVDAHPGVRDDYLGWTIPTLVSLIDDCRAAGNEAQRMEIDVYLLAVHPPQLIEGVGGIG